MMEHVLVLMVGAWSGAFIGIVVAALCSAAGKADRRFSDEEDSDA